MLKKSLELISGGHFEFCSILKHIGHIYIFWLNATLFYGNSLAIWHGLPDKVYQSSKCQLYQNKKMTDLRLELQSLVHLHVAHVARNVILKFQKNWPSVFCAHNKTWYLMPDAVRNPGATKIPLSLRAGDKKGSNFIVIDLLRYSSVQFLLSFVNLFLHDFETLWFNAKKSCRVRAIQINVWVRWCLQCKYHIIHFT